MKTGDIVTATSSPVDVSKDDTTPDVVTGSLEIVPVQFMGRSTITYLVYVQDPDGYSVPVEVEGNSIKPADRRAKVTVLK